MSKMPLLLAVIAAALFGAATPASKMLLHNLSAFQFAGLLYLGAALGVLPLLILHPSPFRLRKMSRKTSIYLGGAISFGGIIAPVLLLIGLRLASAASVSMWLNLELVATAILGYLFFHDYLTVYGWMSAGAIIGASVLLSFNEGVSGGLAALFIAATCLCWGLDNHLTALIDGITPAQTTFWKGIVAGSVNLLLGVLTAPYMASGRTTAAGLGIGVFSYGVSIVLYITAAQRLGATRSQMVFSSSPFLGVALSALLLGEVISLMQIIAGGIFIGAILLLSVERHVHEHSHEAAAHSHWHRHDDEHHEHPHAEDGSTVLHSHPHEHHPLTHSHPHWPDLYHRHVHSS